MHWYSTMIAVLLVVGCRKGSSTDESVTRAQCVAVRDHVVELILGHYRTHGTETFDGLDRADTATMVGIPPGVTRDTFQPFLESEAGKPWLDNARARLVGGAAMTETVDKCVKRGKLANITCWMGAATMETFQRCPTP